MTLRGALLLAAAVLLQPGVVLATPNSVAVAADVKAAHSTSATDHAYPAPGRPGECNSDTDCGPGFACFHGGRCLCKPGRRLCKTACADLQNDAENCGACGHACAAGKACVEGACRTPGITSPLRISPLTTVSQRFTLSGSDGTSVCLHDSQAAPERAAVAGNARVFAAYDTDEYNTANAYDAWGIAEQTPGAYNSNGVTTTLYGEPSATTSDFTGLDYLGYAGKRSDEDNRCVAIAATDSTGLVANIFDYDQGAACATSGLLGVTLDTPTITYDLGGVDLWAAFNTARGSGDDVEEIMEDCEPGQPGCCTNDGTGCTTTCSKTSTEKCPVTSYLSQAATGVRDVPTLAVNPCTHNGIMAYATTDNQIRINVREPDGTLVTDFEIAGSKAHHGNDVCCNGQVRTCWDGSHYCDSNVCSGEPCLRLPARPQIVISEVSGTCYAYIAYDQSTTGSDGHTYYTARLGIYNVTDDSNPTWAYGWVSKDPSSPYNTYGHEVAAAGPYVAWGFYEDTAGDTGACETYFDAYVDKNSMLSSLGDFYTLAGPFPNMRVYGHPSDWVQAISRGVGLGGQLLLTWAQPVCMSTSSCDTCGNANNEIDGCATGQWSHVVKGAVITP